MTLVMNYMSSVLWKDKVMLRQRHILYNQKGGILIFTLLGLMAFILLMSMAVDITYFFIVRNQVRNIADNSALAAMGVFVDRMSNGADRSTAIAEAIQAAKDVGTHSRTLDAQSLAVQIADADVEFGAYNQDTQTFTVENDPDNPGNLVDSIRVTVQKGTLNPRYEFYLKTISGLNDAALLAYATASIVRKNIIFIMDISSSMDDNTYPNHDIPSDEKKPNYDNIGARPLEGFEYYNFQSYPLRTYSFNDPVEGLLNLGGRPEPMYNVLSKVRDFYNITLSGVLDEKDNIGFLTFNADVQDRIRQIFPSDSFIQRDRLGNVATLCQSSLDFYDDYISDAQSLSDSLFTYNPALFRTTLSHFAPLQIGNPLITSVVDYKYPGGQLDRTADRNYPGGSAMRRLISDDTIIFPGGQFPAGEDVNRNKVLSDLLDVAPDGYTNMGGSLRLARNNLATLTATGTPAFNMVILLTDGLPNIRVNWNGMTGAERLDTRWDKYYAKRYARIQADELKNDGVRICTIFYETRGSSGESFLESSIVSEPSAQYHFNTDSGADLDTIFQQILLTFPYVLVE